MTNESVFIRILLFLHLVARNQADYYYNVGKKASWDEAQEACATMDMELGILQTEEEYYDAVNYIKDSGGVNDVWIGLSSDGIRPYNYYWTNRQSISWANWNIGEPDHQSTDKCIRLRNSKSYLFATYTCAQEFEYICSSQSPKRVLSLDNTTMSLPYNSNITLSCEYESLHDVVSIYWRIDNQIESKSHILEVNADKGITTYTVITATQEDIGVYQCFVNNTFGSRGGGEVSLDIIPGLPLVTTNQSDINVSHQQSVTMFCFYEGYPEITSITWLKNNVEKSFNNQTENGLSMLILKDIESSDSGSYSCSASNSLGATNSIPIVIQVSEDHPKCVCPCVNKAKLNNWSHINYDNYTKEQLILMLQPKLKALDKELRLDKKNLTSRRIKLISLTDDRESSRRIGYVAVAFLTFSLSLPILLDLTSFYQHFTKKHNQ